MGRGSRVLLAVALVALVLLPEAAPAQCIMCRRALETPEGQQMAGAFRSGILVLLAAPFSLVGIIAGLVVRMQRRRKQGSF